MNCRLCSSHNRIYDAIHKFLFGPNAMLYKYNKMHLTLFHIHALERIIIYARLWAIVQSIYANCSKTRARVNCYFAIFLKIKRRVIAYCIPRVYAMNSYIFKQ